MRADLIISRDSDIKRAPWGRGGDHHHHLHAHHVDEGRMNCGKNCYYYYTKIFPKLYPISHRDRSNIIHMLVKPCHNIRLVSKTSV